MIIFLDDLGSALNEGAAFPGSPFVQIVDRLKRVLSLLREGEKDIINIKCRQTLNLTILITKDPKTRFGAAFLSSKVAKVSGDSLPPPPWCVDQTVNCFLQSNALVVFQLQSFLKFRDRFATDLSKIIILSIGVG